MADQDYLDNLRKWREEMDANLRRENDRLALAGLFWLQKGFNTFGSSHDCDILLPKPAPRIIGAFEYDGVNVTLTLDLGQSVEVNGEPIQTAMVLQTDDSATPSFVSYQALRMVPIRRAHGVGVRVWDNCRPGRENFAGRKWFDPNEEYRVPAMYTPYPAPIKVKLPNALGEQEDDYMQGYITFTIEGRSRRLDASELDDGRLYLQFKDRSNGITSYEHGRYVYTDPVQEDGLLMVDFNRAFNPPSAFSAYSTCTYAPKQNELKVRVEAGESFDHSESAEA